MLKRKNIRSLSNVEIKEFVDAILKLKSIGIYDKYVQLHSEAMMRQSGRFEKNFAHFGPIFLPWHREFLRRLEKDLGDYTQNPYLAIPYWDWTEDFTNPEGSPLWKDEFMGGNGDRRNNYLVSNGKFSSWGIIRQFGPKLMPNGRIIANTVPEKNDIDNLMNINIYDAPEWDTSTQNSFRNLLEGSGPISYRNEPETHNRIHVWVGGNMSQGNSPSDPIFFLHHANIDRIWASWQKKFYKDSITESYLPKEPIIEEGRTLLGHSINEFMFPWIKDNSVNTGLRGGSVTILSVLDHEKLNYTYEKYE